MIVQQNHKPFGRTTSVSSASPAAAHTEVGPPALFCRRLSSAIALVCFAASPASAQPADLDLQLAREEAVVVTTADRTFRGLLDGMRDGRLFIRHITEGGEVGYSFAPDEVREFTIPGADLASEGIDLWEHGETTEALPLLAAIGRQRFRYLPLLNREQRRPLFALIAAEIAANDPRAAIAFVGLVRPYATTHREAVELRDAELNAYVNLGLTAETRALAEAWCAAADATEGSALGWKILAQIEFDAGNFDHALWTALQPIVFSTYLSLEDLDHCYVLAIASADALGDRATGLRLYREMNARGLTWPDERRFNAVALRFATLSASIESPDQIPLEADATPTSELPNEEPPGLTLETIRKLVAPRSSTSP